MLHLSKLIHFVRDYDEDEIAVRDAMAIPVMTPRRYQALQEMGTTGVRDPYQELKDLVLTETQGRND